MELRKAALGLPSLHERSVIIKIIVNRTAIYRCDTAPKGRVETLPSNTNLGEMKGKLHCP
jgi:hypothetical protein